MYKSKTQAQYLFRLLLHEKQNKIESQSISLEHLADINRKQ